MVNPVPGFAELIRRAEQSDDEALRELFEQYGETIRREIRFCLLDGRLRQVVAESDIYQSVVLRFVAALRKGDCRFDKPGDLVNLLKCMARARVAHVARFWHADRRDVSRNVVLGDGQHSAGEAEFTDTVADAEMYATAIDRLTEQEQRVFHWRLEGIEWSEIASRIAALSPEAARKQHERALARVKCELDPDSARVPE